MAFFQEQQPSREPFLRTPASALGLIAVILVAYAAQSVFLSARELDAFGFNYGLVPARYVPEIWASTGLPPVSIWDGAVPFLSHLFIHGDILHAGINCLLLLLAATPVAIRLGGARMIALFFVTGALSAMVYVAANWGSFDPAIGCSGAVAGVIGAAVRIGVGQRMAARNRPPRQADAADLTRSAPPAPLLSRPVLLFSVLWVVANVAAGTMGWDAPDDVMIAWEAHIAGYFAGLFLVGFIDQPRLRLVTG
jgi:membrane associated rhomboid family serine protease